MQEGAVSEDIRTGVALALTHTFACIGFYFSITIIFALEMCNYASGIACVSRL